LPVTVLPPGAVALGVKVHVPVPLAKVIVHESPVALPMPSNTVTVPVGVPPNSGLTVAVTVVLSPKLMVLGLSISAVDVVAWPTICIAEAMLAVKLPSPL
jgi:hypothetical protein